MCRPIFRTKYGPSVAVCVKDKYAEIKYGPIQYKINQTFTTKLSYHHKSGYLRILLTFSKISTSRV